MPIIRDILLGAEKRRANLALMCQALEINPTDLHNSEIKVPFEKGYRAWEIAVTQTGDKYLGLHLGEQTNPSILGLVGHLMQSCKNLEQAFRSVCQFSEMATDMFKYSMSVKGSECTLLYEPCSPWQDISPKSAQQATEQAMAGTLNVFKILSGRKVFPIKIKSIYPKPKHTIEYERIFQSSIEWKSNSSALVFSWDQMKIPVQSYDESLAGLFNNLISQKLSQLKTETKIDELIKKKS